MIYRERYAVRGENIDRVRRGKHKMVTKRLPSILWWQKCMSDRDTAYKKIGLQKQWYWI